MAEIVFGAIALMLLGVFLGGYIYDTRKHRRQQKP